MASNPPLQERSTKINWTPFNVGVFGAANFSIVRFFASLKLTVALFALAIVLVFIGTLAQIDKDMWEVMEDYFTSWICVVPFKLLFPRPWFPEWHDRIPFAFPLPGGGLIGLLMVINLITAHAVRFKKQTHGLRLSLGIVVIAVGFLVTAAVIASGHNNDGLQTAAPVSWPVLWKVLKYSLLASWILSLAVIVWLSVVRSETGAKLGIPSALCMILAVLAGSVFLDRDIYLGDSGMRILWQLIMGTFAGSVVLAGCILVFRRRAGVVVIHLGVGLLMFGQFWVSRYDVEEQMVIGEGESVNYAHDIRRVELAIVDPNDPQYPDQDTVTVIPLTRNNKETSFLKSESINDERLPFEVKFIDYFKNSNVRQLQPDDSPVATKGKGTGLIIESQRGASGTGGSEVNQASAYVKFTDRDEQQDLGTYLLSQVQMATRNGVFSFDEVIEVGDKSYEVSLRFQRNYKDYVIKLHDVRKEDYEGTDTPRDYSSTVRLVDESRGVDLENTRIWMNNPLRYAGDTFYQSSYQMDQSGREFTVLQVVTNSGWMIPYVACMIVSIGMLAHFLMVLSRFLNRQQTATQPVARSNRPVVDYVLPALVILISAAWLAQSAMPRPAKHKGMEIDSFGKLPLIYQGRVKPFDTLAQNSLRIVSNRTTFKDTDGQRQPAIRWLLDMISNSEAARSHAVIRIDSLEVLNLLELSRRKGFRYSLEDLQPKYETFVKQAMQAGELPPEERSHLQHKILELDKKLRTITMLHVAFSQPPIPSLPTVEEFKDNRQEAQQKLLQAVKQLQLQEQRLTAQHPPLVVPGANPNDSWDAFANAWVRSFLGAQLMGQEPDPLIRDMDVMLAAYSKGDTKKFNETLDHFHDRLEKSEAVQLQIENSPINNLVKMRFGTFYHFEQWFNQFSPFYRCLVLYVFAFLLVAIGWLVWKRQFHRMAFWLVVLTFALHTFGLLARIYISGRPPVTNLYSSAVFIGWATVVLGLLLEYFYRSSIGLAVSCALGFASLVIAHNLAGDGDTFTVLQAVLDTQFWLATHVVTITLGYATTYVAGGLAIIYILCGLFNKNFVHSSGRDLIRMIYGTLCFAIFFSFVGTVLGGLWADDSWGRFWGWDPKENGALIIVLWNALLLHARWDGLVKQTGLATLAVGGNVVTSWSWFGVNELGVGLHSYGFTEGVLAALGICALCNLALMAGGIYLSIRQRST